MSRGSAAAVVFTEPLSAFPIPWVAAMASKVGCVNKLRFFLRYPNNSILSKFLRSTIFRLPSFEEHSTTGPGPHCFTGDPEEGFEIFRSNPFIAVWVTKGGPFLGFKQYTRNVNGTNVQRDLRAENLVKKQEC